MTTTRAARGLLAAFILAVPVVTAAQGPPAAPAPRLTLDRLYSLPRPIGTAPRAPAWSPDGTRLAFLWNDEGTNVYDVWMLSTGAPAPVRLTRVPRREVPPTLTDAAARRTLENAIEQDPGVTDVQWHPDGTRLLFVSGGDLLTVTPAGETTRLTETEVVERAPAFNPAGTALAYLAGGALWVHDLTPGAVARAVARPEATDVSIDRFFWSPDGRSLAFVETDRRGIRQRLIPDYLPEEARATQVRRAFPGEDSESRRLGLVPAGGGDPRWIDRGGTPLDPIFSVAWAPDGRRLLIDTSDLFVKHRRILLVATATGEATLWYEERDPGNVTAGWWAGWAPDGAGVYFVSDRDEDYHLYYRALAGGAPVRLTSGPWAVEGVQIVAAARAAFVTGNRGRPEERHLFRVPFGGGEAERVTVRPGTHAALVSPDGRHVADVFSNDTTPPDLYLTSLASAVAEEARERRVTVSPLPEFAQSRWPTVSYVTFPNHRDGVTLHGRLLLPPGFDPARGRHPAIIGSIYTNSVRNQWGGRTAHPTWGLDAYLAQEGFVILNIDVAGSAGRGKAFRQRIRLDYGGVDIEDVYSGARYLGSLPGVDKDRIGLWGSSYGGLMTAKSLFTRPGVFKAGIAGAPATNVRHALTGEMRVMMRPQDQPAAYDHASAYRFADGLQDALMIVHGMRDRIVLFRDSVALVQRLLLAGKDVEFVVLPDAEHGWDTEGLAQTRFAFRKMVAFFERHLGKGPR